MKKKSLLLSAIFLLGLAMPQIAFAQGGDSRIALQTVNVSLQEVALLAIPAVSVSLSLSGATVAGAPVAVQLTDALSRMRITSLITTATRRVEAQITTGTLPGGTMLQVEATNALQNFVGEGGASSGIKILSSVAAVEVLNSIGSCHSGVDPGDGYVLTYSFGEDDLPETSPVAGSAAITITYTMVDES